MDTVSDPSAARSTLSLTNVTLAHAGPYLVVASDAGGLSATSQMATLTVDATFTRITQGAIVSDPGNSYVPTWGDYDGDDWLDLVVGNGGNEGPAVPFLQRNDRHGGFLTLTAADLGPLAADAVQAAQAHWVDYDNNGTLDLFIGSANSADDHQ